VLFIDFSFCKLAYYDPFVCKYIKVRMIFVVCKLKKLANPIKK